MPFTWRVRAAAAVAIIPPLLEIASFARLERWLQVAARRQISSAPSDADAARWVDRQLMRLPRPWAHSCLRRATVLYFLLRSAGRAVSLCIGVRRDDDGALHAHAWLLLDDVLYLESAQGGDHVADFNEIARFPHAASRST
ncbi:MAG: lasso peptide biosynthesis B2 protein [bacterium]